MKHIAKVATAAALSAGLIMVSGPALAADVDQRGKVWTIRCVDSGTSETAEYKGDFRYLTRNVTSLKSGGGAYFEYKRYEYSSATVGSLIGNYPSNVCTATYWSKNIWG